jgi:cytidylate kinase
VIVAIDGGVATGKSAVGRRVATALDLNFVDSGLMYRAIARLAGQRTIDARDVEELTELANSVRIRIEGDRVWADGAELSDGIYDASLSESLTLISATPSVREALVEQQRALGAAGVVMVGRDIGTVVFPGADYKFFLVASVEERVRRRAAQFERRGEKVDKESMRREVEARDRADSERAVAPLRPATDAVIVDTDKLDLDRVVDLIVGMVRR